MVVIGSPLSLLGSDRMEQRQPRCKAGGTAKLPISPLVGEMSGRTEGGRRIAIASLPHDQPGIDMRCSCKGLK
ncbi:MAG: hypothetical protein E5Y61_32075, partial [Mesorhizobium sp.]